MNKALSDLMLGNNPKERAHARKVLKSPVFHYKPGLHYSDHRERVIQQLLELKHTGLVTKAFPKEYGGEDEYAAHIAGFEELIIADPSLQIKAGVQYGLFTAALQHLGTERHHKAYLQKAINLQMLGSYGMTESGHGSDVFNIKTTATYDPTTQEFVIHTPSRDAWKDYLGNAAKHGKWAVVFAQLYTKGENQGVHAFLVQTKNIFGFFKKGFSGEDDGLKGGLNGIDNGRLSFNQVRIPRENLLNRYGDVAPDGTYSSPIVNPKRRFFIMLGTLVQGRVSLDGAAVAVSKLALQIAVTYANRRRQFPDSKGREVLLLDYQSHQRRLLPLLAETYASHFAHEELLVDFDTVFKKLSTSNGEEVEGMQELEIFAAAMKASNTWHALNTLQESREACGGNGFLQENHIAQLRADFDVYVTFEGDNTVLMQLVAKRLLTDYSNKFKQSTLIEKISMMTNDTVSKVKNKVSPLISNEDLEQVLSSRVDMMTAQIASRLYTARKNGENMDSAFNSQQVNAIELAKAYAELIKMQAFNRQLAKLEGYNYRLLSQVARLYALDKIQKNMGWYLTNGALTPKQSKEIAKDIDGIYVSLSNRSQELVDAFGYESEHLRAAIIA